MNVSCPECRGELGRSPEDRNTVVCLECFRSWVISITDAQPRPTERGGRWEDGQYAPLIRAIMDADGYQVFGRKVDT